MFRSPVLSSTLLMTALLATGAEVPRKAPDFAIQTGPRKYIWLSEQTGKTVVLGFILTTCPHCQFTTGILNRIHKDYADKGVVVFESAIEPMSSLNIPNFVKQLGVTFPVGYNEQNYAGKFLGKEENEPMMMPQVVIVDSKGMIRAQYAGDDLTFSEGIQETTLRDRLDELTKGQATTKPPAPKSTVKTR
jgi:peroxiredoxin